MQVSDPRIQGEDPDNSNQNYGYNGSPNYPCIPQWLTYLFALVVAIGSIAGNIGPIGTFLGLVGSVIGDVTTWVFVTLPASSPVAHVIIDVVVEIVFHLRP